MPRVKIEYKDRNSGQDFEYEYNFGTPVYDDDLIPFPEEPKMPPIVGSLTDYLIFLQHFSRTLTIAKLKFQTLVIAMVFLCTNTCAMQVYLPHNKLRR